MWYQCSYVYEYNPLLAPGKKLSLFAGRSHLVCSFAPGTGALLELLHFHPGAPEAHVAHHLRAPGPGRLKGLFR